jgi:hypothetical protein
MATEPVTGHLESEDTTGCVAWFNATVLSAAAPPRKKKAGCRATGAPVVSPPLCRCSCQRPDCEENPYAKLVRSEINAKEKDGLMIIVDSEGDGHYFMIFTMSCRLVFYIVQERSYEYFSELCMGMQSCKVKISSGPSAASDISILLVHLAIFCAVSVLRSVFSHFTLDISPRVSPPRPAWLHHCCR